MSLSEQGALKLSDFRGDCELPDERRQEPRIKKRRTISVMRCGQRMHFENGFLDDCSTHGVGIILSRPMKAEEQFVLKVRLKRLTLVLYTVRHCRELESGQYKIGAKVSGFIATPEEHEDFGSILEGLLDEKSCE